MRPLLKLRVNIKLDWPPLNHPVLIRNNGGCTSILLSDGLFLYPELARVMQAAAAKWVV
jgi:hypothetical protein